MTPIRPTSYNVTINNIQTVVYLYDYKNGVLACFFEKPDGVHDFINSYDAFGFTISILDGKPVLSPMRLRPITKLTQAIMKDITKQIIRQHKVAKKKP